MAKTKLHILMLTEYFYPQARGGSEQSAYYLAKALIQHGHQVSVLTPNYGAKAIETWQRIRIFRFGIGKKLSSAETSLTPFWHTNLFWFLTSLLALWRPLRQWQPKIIHVQGKYFLPAAVIIGKLYRLPVIFTARDYQIICNLGLCLWDKPHRCSLKEFLFAEFPNYLQRYLPHASFLSYCLQLIFALRGRLISRWLYFFARQTHIVTISRKEQRIFAANGLNSKVIYNTMDFPQAVSVPRKPQIIFAGRLTPGKGAHLLIPTLSQFQAAAYKLIIAGDGILRSKLQSRSSIKLLGQISHRRLIQLYQQSQLAIFPSVWPEPFGRGALEALAAGTPVVTSNRGGLPEIVQDKYGLSVEPTPEKLAQAIKQVLQNYHQYVNNIRQDRQKLNFQFNLQPVSQYEKLYSSCLS